MFVFAMLFVGFMVDRNEEKEIFNASSAALNVELGLFNTIVLLTSGLFMVFAVNAGRRHDRKWVQIWVLLAFVVGAAFGIAKIFEYADKFSHGISMVTNNFYMFYYALTGAHLLHFLGGMGALLVLLFKTRKQDVDEAFFVNIEAVGLYWHMVDLLWLFIFPLLYLLEAS